MYGVFMKKIFLLLFAFVILSTNLYSQAFKYVKASEVKSDAIQAAIADGLAEPRLVFVATAEIEFELFGLPIPFKINMDDGTAGMWIYIFTDDEYSNFWSYMLIKPMMGNTIVSPMDAEDIITEATPISFNMTLDDFTWLDSDVALQELKGSAQFMQAYNQEYELFALGLFVNGGISGLSIDEPCWGATISQGGDDTFCAVHALNREVICMTEASILDNLVGNVNIYPNPAQDYINLEFETMQDFGNVQIQLFDAIGNLQNPSITGHSNSVKIDTKVLQTGTYFIRIGSKFYSFIKN